MPSSVAKHTIPPFYACYFLRSLSSPGTTYIGSTPAPPRRKRQHNGDLTQGAYKTARARPWEMECIVYGFSSKIAALQFEWAWAKPHLSRHLKFLTAEHTADGAPSDTSAWVGMPLFPSSSMTPGQTRWGKPKRRIARPPSTPNARLLAMRALLRSEPFSGWGLKLAFFTEWSWLAYQRLESAQHVAGADTNPRSAPILQVDRYSRSGKPLHPLYPVALCDFSGVDGKRIPLIHVSDQHRQDAGVADQPVKKRQSSSKNKVPDDGTPQWPEALPRSANLKGIDACVQDFAAFPSPPPPLPSTDLIKKAKRVTKASTDPATGRLTAEEENGAEEEDADAEDSLPAVSSAEPGSACMRLLHRMRFDDLDVEESEWRRFEGAISTRLSSSTTVDAGQAMSHFMQTCVERHIAAQDARTLHEAPPAPTAPCAVCHEAVDLTRQLDFVLCPLPHTFTLPIASTASAAAGPDPVQPVDSNCSSVFHLGCLADTFLKQHGADEDATGSTSTILPTHGVCPQHAAEPGQAATWADVVRAMYRRSERFERLLQLLVRSGCTLAELRNPPEIEATAKTVKPRSRAKPVAGVTRTEAETVDAAPEKQGKTGKTTGTRKRRQPTAGVVDTPEASTSEAQAPDGGTEGANKETKRKASRKTKAVDPAEVIDLT